MKRVAFILPVFFGACEGGHHRAAWRTVTKAPAPASDARLPSLLTDTELKGFLPSRLGDRVGMVPKGEMTRMGDRALSEASRSYLDAEAPGAPDVHLKLADARLEPAAAQAIRSLAGTDDETQGERVVLPGAIGYARYDEGGRVAQAQVLIAGRFIASATVDEADDASEAAEALRALDTLAIARRAQATQ